MLAHAIIAFAAILCMVLCASCGAGGGSQAAKSTAQTETSKQAATSSKATSAPSASGEGSRQPAHEEIDPRYVGEWVGHDVYTMQDLENTYVLRDNGDWATLVVNADGSASFEGDVAGSSLALTDLRLERATKGYLVYDQEGALVGSLGYERSGTTDWLILSVPDDEVGMVCYTFFINDRV